jgi:hypothetical protein
VRAATFFKHFFLFIYFSVGKIVANQLPFDEATIDWI